MKLLGDSKAIGKEVERLIERAEKVSFAVAWATTNFPAYDALIRSERKIYKGVVGMHFYQTSPDFLAAFKDNLRVRFCMSPSGVFHPKMFVFDGPGDGWSCILGSANLTRAAFTRNEEACLLFTEKDDASGRLGRELGAQIDKYWRMGRRLKKGELQRYTSMAERFKRKFFGTGTDQNGRAEPRPPHDVEILGASWKEYYAQVSVRPGMEGRMQVIAAARRLFSDYKSFADMPRECRQGIAATRRGSDDDVPWGWFGSMVGAGSFKNRINVNDGALSTALDQVPSTGPVLREDFLAYIDLYNSGEWRRGIATATRLLAMKRPDYFLCLDAANRAGVADAFGVSIGPHDYKKYWDEIVLRVLDSEWWNSRRPSNGVEAVVWSARVAFLDALYYEEI